MVRDDVRNLHSYFPLDEALRHISEEKTEEVPVFHSFNVNKACTVIVTVEKGSITASTSWRESPESRDVTAAVKAKSGEFVLFLPGEPFLVRFDTEETEAVMRVLRSHNGG